MLTRVRASAGSDAKTIVQVQWLRAVAAIMVVFHHAVYYANLPRETAGLPTLKFLGMPYWAFGIQIFFVISGFLMVKATPDFGARGAPFCFLVRRIIRIVPLYWLLTTVSVIAVLLNPAAMPIDTGVFAYIAKSYLFIPVLRTAGDMRPILSQGWTLDYEMFFYLAFAVSMLAPRRFGLPALAAAFLTFAWVGRDATIATPVFYTVTDGLLVVFLFGCGLALVHERGFRLPAPVAIVMAIVGVAWLFTDLSGPVALSAGVPALLIVAALVLRPAPRDTRAARSFAYVGDASYSLYLTHTFTLRIFARLWSHFSANTDSINAFIIAASLVAVGVSLFVYAYLERPMTKGLLRRFFGTQKSRAHSGPSSSRHSRWPNLAGWRDGRTMSMFAKRDGLTALPERGPRI